MRLLVLGGTVFLGRHVAAEAIARGHEVTLFHRGVHGADLFAGEAEHLLGDRTTDLSPLHGREWDAAIDTSGFESRHVTASCAVLAGAVGHLAFVSSCSVYPDWPADAVTEDSPVWDDSDGEDYGQEKASCERAAEAAMPDRVAVARAGTIVGPHDNVFRLPWWVQRVARGGEVVAPAPPDRGVQLIDARDLATWLVDMCERREPGVFNAVPRPGEQTMGDVLGAAITATSSDALPRWTSDEALRAAGVEPWTGLPLWLPADEYPGAWSIDAGRAHASGLRCRPVADTVSDVAGWLRDGGGRDLPAWRADARPSGLTAEQERELLQAG